MDKLDVVVIKEQLGQRNESLIVVPTHPVGESSTAKNNYIYLQELIPQLKGLQTLFTLHEGVVTDGLQLLLQPQVLDLEFLDLDVEDVALRVEVARGRLGAPLQHQLLTFQPARDR